MSAPNPPASFSGARPSHVPIAGGTCTLRCRVALFETEIDGVAAVLFVESDYRAGLAGQPTQVRRLHIQWFIREEGILK